MIRLFAGASLLSLALATPAFAAESAYGHLLHDTLAGEGIHVAQLVIPGAIVPGHLRKDPAVLADTLWEIHRDRHGFRHFADDLDS